MDMFVRRGSLFLAAAIFVISLIFLGRVGHDLMAMQKDLNWARLEQAQLYRLYTVTVDAEIARLHQASQRDENSSREFAHAIGAVRQEADDAARVSVRYEPSPFVVSTVKLMSEEASSGTVLLSNDGRAAKDAAGQNFDRLAPRLRSDLRMALEQNQSYTHALNAGIATEATTFLYVLLSGIAGIVLAYFVTNPRRANAIEQKIVDHEKAIHFWD